MTLLDAPQPGSDPFNLFDEWFEGAKSSEPFDPDAACLATATENGKPSARMVLVRKVDSRGFVFYTNEHSRKGRELIEGGFAALCYHWKSMERQVRVEGAVLKLDNAESDLYHAARPRESRISAWASQQSQPLESRAVFLERVAQITAHYEGKDVPRPPHWGGFRIVPERIEFWQAGESRMHDRFVFTREKAGWSIQRLYP